MNFETETEQVLPALLHAAGAVAQLPEVAFLGEIQLARHVHADEVEAFLQHHEGVLLAVVVVGEVALPPARAGRRGDCAV